MGRVCNTCPLPQKIRAFGTPLCPRLLAALHATLNSEARVDKP